MSLIGFVIFSAFLCLICNLLTKVVPKLTQWSLFWIGILLVSFMPLFPLTFFTSDSFIPTILLNDFAQSSQLIKGSNEIINQVHTYDFWQNTIVLSGILLGIGSLVSLYRFIISWITIQNFANDAVKVNDLASFNKQELKFITHNGISIRQSDLSHSPFVFGIFKYTIVIPKNIDDMPQEQKQLLLKHELTHAKRRDPVAVFIYRLCVALFWFNPFLKGFERGFINAMELNCDADVLTELPSQKSAYARALLSSLKLYQTPLNMSALTHFSDPKLDKSTFEIRIRAAMTAKIKKQYGFTQKLLLLSIILLLGAFSFITKATLDIDLITSGIKGLKPVKDARSISNFDDVNVEAIDMAALKLNIKGLKPVKEAWISSNFDEVNEYRGAKPHQGVDFAAKHGTDITASFSGRVLIANSTSLHKNYGKVILIRNSQNDMQSLYAHLDSFNVTAGQRIKAGDVIGTVGNTGRVTGPHLHFELIKNNKRLNPNNYLNL